MKYNHFFAQDLPTRIKMYVTKCFPHLSIASAQEKKTPRGTGYYVGLNDGTEIDFSPTGSSIKVFKKHEGFFPISL